LAKVASGGELARTMLAVRLVLGRSGSANGAAPSADVGGAQDADDGAARAGAATLVFDEVDAGIGGEAALAVGRALADLARRHQVLVVTHLPQVAAFADQQIAVYKDEIDGRTVATVQRLDEHERIVELSRMLSGQPDSAAARRHAKELLSLAQRTIAGL
jgi:DNA repair protein RecN (Recombination protein N)